MGYTLKEIKELRSLATEAKLEKAEILLEYHNSELQTICNGIGPECFPDWLREGISVMHPSLLPVAFIHDVEWHENDGRLSDFIASNHRFKRNGYKMAKHRYAWFDPRRYIVMRQASRLARICLLFGYPAWKAATKKEVK